MLSYHSSALNGAAEKQLLQNVGVKTISVGFREWIIRLSKQI